MKIIDYSSKLSNVVGKKDVVKKIEFEKLVKKVNNINTTDPTDVI